MKKLEEIFFFFFVELLIIPLSWTSKKNQ
jgi:hypothetical protein